LKAADRSVKSATRGGAKRAAGKVSRSGKPRGATPGKRAAGKGPKRK
jgi:hypothetical protein